MIRKKIILADEDERYLKELCCEFMEKAPQLELITFTESEKVYQYLEQGGHADILAVDEGIAGKKLEGLSHSMTRIALSASMTPIDGFETVRKYQRMENLMDEILLKYAQDSGTLETVRGDSHTRIAAFYSPAGGTGKTALSLALAASGAKSGLRTLYLNLEEIDSVKGILRPTPGSLTDLFLMMDVNWVQMGLKLKESIGMEPGSGFSYISGVESISEYEEIRGDMIQKVLAAVRELSSFDLVILDLGSGFTEKTRRILEEADVIFMPVTAEEGSSAKLQRFLEESSIHGKYDALFEKMHLILNRTRADGTGMDQQAAAVNRLSYCAGIAFTPILSKLGSILQSGEILIPLMNPILQAAMAGESGGVR